MTSKFESCGIVDSSVAIVIVCRGYEEVFFELLPFCVGTPRHELALSAWHAANHLVSMVDISLQNTGKRVTAGGEVGRAKAIRRSGPVKSTGTEEESCCSTGRFHVLTKYTIPFSQRERHVQEVYHLLPIIRVDIVLSKAQYSMYAQEVTRKYLYASSCFYLAVLPLTPTSTCISSSTYHKINPLLGRTTGDGNNLTVNPATVLGHEESNDTGNVLSNGAAAERAVVCHHLLDGGGLNVGGTAGDVVPIAGVSRGRGKSSL